MQATAQTTEFRATTAPARAGFLGLAVAITFTLLYSVGQIADQQFDAATLAQAGSTHQVAQAAHVDSAARS